MIKKKKKLAEKQFIRIVICKLKGHKISYWWHYKFNKKHTRRKRIKEIICVTCTNEIKKIVIL